VAHIAIFDCAIKRPSLVCFNRLVSHLATPFSYHRPPQEGLSSAKQDNNASAYIIFGSASNVEDRLDWHKELSDFCREKLEQKVPVLGLCFGHQLMADSFGMEVIKNENEQSFYGTRTITFKETYGALSPGDKSTVFKAHSYQVAGHLKELQVMATSEECPFDGLYHPTLPYWGFQGHPEASLDFYQHEIAEKNATLNSSLSNSPREHEEKERALKDGLNLVRIFCQEL
jgi:GMP synthase (glutamine-hydrolysing)